MLKPRMYLDFDGVLNAKYPQHTTVETFSIEIDGSRFLAPVTHITYSPTVVAELDRLCHQYGLEIVWLSTWNENSDVLRLSTFLNGLHSATALPAVLNAEAIDKKEWTQWKAHAIIDDQAKRPSPFIWVDDNAHRFHSETVEKAVGSRIPKLFLTPKSEWGLTEEDIKRIETFLKGTNS